MLAIHNIIAYWPKLTLVANAFAKLSKCQQFTTLSLLYFIKSSLQTLLQSYQNVSNSQPSYLLALCYTGCKRFCKVIKMLAIHNCKGSCHIINSVANAFAKLSKCQQFTTYELFFSYFYMLQTLLQSYQNVSNSQPYLFNFDISNGCKRFCKVIKMLAIHNEMNKQNKLDKVANAFAKLSKCQQFTTSGAFYRWHKWLQTLLQSYQNVSNSQLK